MGQCTECTQCASQGNKASENLISWICALGFDTMSTKRLWCVVCTHLVVDGRPKQKEDKAESHHGEDAKERGQEDGQPDVGLA